MNRNFERLVYRLDELGKEHITLVGKKCAHLGELTKAGFPVPKGFALTLEAYDLFLKETGTAEELKRYFDGFDANPDDNGDFPKFSAASAAVRGLVESKGMPEPIAGVVGQYYSELCEATGCTDLAVSTRSAGPESHPGQYESFLHISGMPHVMKHIIKVWASTFNTRSLIARARGGFALDRDPIGVCVLQMVNAKAAGVIFTLNPTNGDPSKIVIEGNWGLGESVVSGSVNPDQWTVDKVTLECVACRLSRKNSEYVLDVDSGKVTEVATPQERVAAPCLTEDEVIELAKAAKRIERHYGTAQDIEWAIHGDYGLPESVFILQTRPETGWSKEKEKPATKNHFTAMDYIAGSISSTKYGGFKKP
jgi:pyruvate,water dikinase